MGFQLPSPQLVMTGFMNHQQEFYSVSKAFPVKISRQFIHQFADLITSARWGWLCWSGRTWLCPSGVGRRYDLRGELEPYLWLELGATKFWLQLDWSWCWVKRSGEKERLTRVGDFCSDNGYTPLKLGHVVVWIKRGGGCSLCFTKLHQT